MNVRRAIFGGLLCACLSISAAIFLSRVQGDSKLDGAIAIVADTPTGTTESTGVVVKVWGQDNWLKQVRCLASDNLKKGDTVVLRWPKNNERMHPLIPPAKGLLARKVIIPGRH